MWAEAILMKADLEQVTGELFPLKIAIGDGGQVVLTDRRDLALMPDVGLRMTVTAEIHWPVLGVHVPVSIRSATLEIRPEIVETGDGPSLAFKLHLDDIDIHVFPAMVDRGIVDLVNRELDAKHVELAWGFTRALSHVFALPDALASAGGLDLRAESGRVKITSEALALAVLFRAAVQRRGAEPVVPAPDEPAPVRATENETGARRIRDRSPLALGVLGGLAMVVGAGLHALLANGRRT